jgi:co-chaperonin GroES (HSP10)
MTEAQMKAEQKNLPCLPLGDRILVELITSIKSAGGIDLPEKEVKYGIVKAIGGGVPVFMINSNLDNTKCCGLEVDCKVFLPRGGNVGDRFEKDGKSYLLVSSPYIAAILP